MRLHCPQQRLDCLPIADVRLNLNCRDEIVPILRALQHLYADASLRQQLLTLVAQDINPDTDRKRGRRGLNYWEITVLAATRLGCDLDYDKLQDLAENHRTLRHIMGIGDWQEAVDFDWRRIENNLCKLRPQTLKQISDLVVHAGHALVPEAIETVRGDTFVVETDIHYPTESSLIYDGLRKVVPLAAKLAREYGVAGWRQHRHRLKAVRKLVRKIDRVSRSKDLRRRTARLKEYYRQLTEQAEELLQRACRLLAGLGWPADPLTRSLEQLKGMQRPARREELLSYYVSLTERVCVTARQRVLGGEKVANGEKLFSIFEPHTELIRRGKQPLPVQFGHNVLVVEDGVGFVIDYQVVSDGVTDQELVVPVMKRLQERFEGKIRSASFDRGFHSPENQEELAELVPTPCLAAKGEEKGRRQQEEGSVEFRAARRRHAGVESAIGALQGGNGQKRCRDRSRQGYERYVGLGMLGRNLHTLGKLLLGREEARCEAARSKRGKESG